MEDARYQKMEQMVQGFQQVVEGYQRAMAEMRSRGSAMGIDQSVEKLSDDCQKLAVKYEKRTILRNGYARARVG